ncbi:MAG: ferredoxin reductase, partial [Steroidobacter sp.]
MNEWLTVRIESRQQEAADIVSFQLVDPAGQALPPFTAGAHIDVEIKPGLIRQYSLCNAPGDSNQLSSYLIAVLKETVSRGGSVAMHEFAEGSLLKISTPKNHFPLVTEAKKSLLFAGGIGVTPLLSMAEQLSRDGSDFTMHYCARSPDRMAFVSRIRQSSFARQVSLHLDNGSFAQRLAPEKELSEVDTHAHVYMCGQAGFMNWITNVARSMGWPEAQLHREYFSEEP